MRLTTAQALVLFLTRQHSELDGVERRFVPGCFGIFGHGNVAGVGQALQQYPELRYYQSRNEQAMVHAAAAFSKHMRRSQIMACTTSVGPGATNMVTAAAGATINNVPVLLLPSDTFARRHVRPVLQQLEVPSSLDVTVNDAFRPVSTYWDRIQRPDQLPSALLEAMRTLTSPREVGAVTLCLPQDVQTESWDYPEALFHRRVWRIARPRPDRQLLEQAAAWIREARRPMIVTGGGVLYSWAEDELARLAERTGIPVGETQAGKGALPYDHPCAMGAIGATGTTAANRLAAEADLVVGVGTRWTDFTTASESAFQHHEVRFINLNVAEVDAFKHWALPVIGDARAALAELGELLGNYQVPPEYRQRCRELAQEWDQIVSELYAAPPREGRLVQSAVIGAVNELSRPQDVVLCAAGSLPGDLHKLWRTRDPRGYHMEYGFSCMGYEIAGALGVKMAEPEREVYCLVGDGSYLMMAQELATAVQEGIKLIVVVLDNSGYASIGGLSESVGSDGFGTHYRYRTSGGELDGEPLPVDLEANARSLGARTLAPATMEELRSALCDAQESRHTTVIVVRTHREVRVGSFESWWDVPVAEVSEMESVQQARAEYETKRQRQRQYLGFTQSSSSPEGRS